MTTSLSEMGKVLRSDGVALLVVQDSYYKEVKVDLQRAVTEIARTVGLTRTARKDFPVSHLRARMNPRAHVWGAERTTTESLLVFERSST